MITWEDIKKYFWFLFGTIGVVFFWAGAWDGLGSLPYVQSPWISLAIGIIMLSLSGVIFKGANPLWEVEKPIHDIVKKINRHPQKQEFHIKYADHVSKKELLLKADKLKNIEKDFLIFLEKGKEVFIPVHRVTEILHKGKTHWKA